jgi:hypothetical protein
MKQKPIIIDLETKYTFRQFTDPKKLKISVLAIYDYATNQGITFLEEEINKAFSYFENASYVIGYNIKSFDLQVFQAYYPGNVENFSVFDILEDVREKVGRRLGLNDLLIATLNKRKTGHGLLAIEYYKNKEFDKLRSYCLDDVILTKEIFDYGVKNKKIYYLTPSGKAEITVDWERYLEGDNGKKSVSLTLPF